VNTGLSIRKMMTKEWPCHGSRGRPSDSHRKDPVRYKVSPVKRGTQS